MSRRFQVVIELDMPDDCDTIAASSWADAVLETAFTKPSPTPRFVGRKVVRSTVRMPPAEHPFKPRVVRAVEVK